MENTLTAIEMTGTADEHHRLLLDGEVPTPGPARVRVLVLYPLDDELDEGEWLSAAARHPVFAYLHNPGEDIYGPADGEPFDDETLGRTRALSVR